MQFGREQALRGYRSDMGGSLVKGFRVSEFQFQSFGAEVIRLY